MNFLEFNFSFTFKENREWIYKLKRSLFGKDPLPNFIIFGLIMSAD